MNGKVYLVGAGPGDPELLTLKAARLLRTADAVLHDDLVSAEILNLIPVTANARNVGKRCGVKSVRQEEINFLMVTLASSGRQVVRLKSGDPMIFGRSGEEIEALRRAGVAYEIVPGITSALGAAASTEIPLTDRGAASAVVFVTAHQAAHNQHADWNRVASSGATLVIYMPGKNYGDIGRSLVSAGVASSTPCAIVSRATTPQEQVHRTTIQDLNDVPSLPAPTLLIVGEVVRLGRATESAWNEIAEQFAKQEIPAQVAP
ncbi:MAG TPA: uroporphyrinogen-III C-methyltransferase [Terriglobales bacterium]|nr:uroporphyrinogen-III C-methyltransferase [Terriglobales bacterium]